MFDLKGSKVKQEDHNSTYLKKYLSLKALNFSGVARTTFLKTARIENLPEIQGRDIPV